jgi:hypothetical protein
MPSLIVKKCEPERSSGNRSDMICNESVFGRVCGTDVSRIFNKQIYDTQNINITIIETGLKVKNSYQILRQVGE